LEVTDSVTFVNTLLSVFQHMYYRSSYHLKYMEFFQTSNILQVSKSYYQLLQVWLCVNRYWYLARPIDYVKVIESKKKKYPAMV